MTGAIHIIVNFSEKLIHIKQSKTKQSKKRNLSKSNHVSHIAHPTNRNHMLTSLTYHLETLLLISLCYKSKIAFLLSRINQVETIFPIPHINQAGTIFPILHIYQTRNKTHRKQQKSQGSAHKRAFLGFITTAYHYLIHSD